MNMTLLTAICTSHFPEAPRIYGDRQIAAHELEQSVSDGDE